MGNGGNTCSGASSESSACNTHCCPVNGLWSTWTSWSRCSKSCGTGSQTRTRSCNQPAPSCGGSSCRGSGSEGQDCNTQCCPVAGGWGSWASWGQCFGDNEFCQRARRRSCNNPTPRCGGRCSGSSNDYDNCSPINATPTFAERKEKLVHFFKN